MGEAMLERKMTKRAARKWVRQHWATYMHGIDCPAECPEEVAEIWSEESRRLALRLGLFRDFDLLEPT